MMELLPKWHATPLKRVAGSHPFPASGFYKVQCRPVRKLWRPGAAAACQWLSSPFFNGCKEPAASRAGR